MYTNRDGRKRAAPYAPDETGPASFVPADDGRGGAAQGLRTVAFSRGLNTNDQVETLMSRLTRLSLAVLLFAGGCAALTPAPPPDRDASLRLAAGFSALETGAHAEAYEELAWVFAHCHGQEAGAQAGAAMAALELDPANPGGRPAVGMELLGDLILDPDTPESLRPLVRTLYTLGLGLGAPPAPAQHVPPDPEDEEAPDTSPGAPADTVPAPPTEIVPTVIRDTLPPPSAPDTTPDPPSDTFLTDAPASLADARAVAETASREARDPGGVGGNQETAVLDVESAAVHGCGPPLTSTRPADTRLPTLPGPSLAAMVAEAETALEEMEIRADSLQQELAAARRELAETRAELDRIRRTLRP